MSGQTHRNRPCYTTAFVIDGAETLLPFVTATILVESHLTQIISNNLKDYSVY